MRAGPSGGFPWPVPCLRVVGCSHGPLVLAGAEWGPRGDIDPLVPIWSLLGDSVRFVFWGSIGELSPSLPGSLAPMPAPNNHSIDIHYTTAGHNRCRVTSIDGECWVASAPTQQILPKQRVSAKHGDTQTHRHT